MKPLAALLIALIGFAVMFRLLSLKATVVLILLAGALPVYGPPLLRAAQDLPVWVLAVGGAWIGLALLRVLVRPLLGKEAANNMAGELAAGLVRLTLQIALLPVRAVRALARGVGFWDT
jgi:hypothetical protein